MEIAKMAKVNLLEPFEEISYAVEYAKLFSLNPEDVYQMNFNSVVAILASERRSNEYRERYSEMDKFFNNDK